MNVPPINYGGKVQRPPGRRGCRRDDYYPRPRPTHDAAASCGRSTVAPARLRRAYAIPRAPGLSRVLLRRAGRCPARQHARQALRGQRCPTASMQRRASCARRFAARPIPMPTPASAAVTQAAKRCRSCKRGCRGRQLVRQRLRLFPRATVDRDADVHPTRHEDPGPSHLLLGEKSSKCAGPPCGTPRGRGVLVSLSPAAEDGGPGVASAPGQPRSGFRCVDPDRDRPSSAHAPCRFLPAAKTDAAGVLNPGRRPGSESCGLRPLHCVRHLVPPL